MYRLIVFIKMPNWVYNIITIKGENADIEQFLSDANKHNNGVLSFASWIPVPETFIKYDTTNYPNGERLEIGKPFPCRGDDAPIVTQELIDEYKTATTLQMEQYEVVGWYEYNCKTYGCKWDSKLNVESQSENELTLSCETPWAEPVNFFCTMSERYPSLSFEMASDSVEGGFYGKYKFVEGETTILESGINCLGEYISDDVGPIKRWMKIKWILLKFNVELFPSVFCYRIGHIWGRIKQMLGMIEPKQEDDELPF